MQMGVWTHYKRRPAAENAPKKELLCCACDPLQKVTRNAPLASWLVTATGAGKPVARTKGARYRFLQSGFG